jgi:hypothetical protein
MKNKQDYLDHLENKVEDLQLENELLLLKLKEDRDIINRVKAYIYRNAIYTNGHATIDNIEGVFSTKEIKDILYILEGEL